MIGIAILAVGVLLVGAVLLKVRSTNGQRSYLVISAYPLLLTVIIPAGLGIESAAPTDWLRVTSIRLTLVGIALSFVLSAIGAALTVRAASAGDRTGAALLAFQTVLAGVPAAVFSATEILLR